MRRTADIAAGERVRIRYSPEHPTRYAGRTGRIAEIIAGTILVSLDRANGAAVAQPLSRVGTRPDGPALPFGRSEVVRLGD